MRRRENGSPSFYFFRLVISLTMKMIKYFSLLVLLVLSGCNGGMVDRLLNKTSPYDSYLSSLESTSLANYALVQDWKKAGEGVFRDSLHISLPYQEIGYFDPKSPEALLLRYEVKEGQEVRIVLDQVSQKQALFFMDVYEWNPVDQRVKNIHFADSLGKLSYEVLQSGIHALRLQPELLRGGVYSLSITARGLLSFPISDKGTENIASFWGDPRDGDARKHEGVDIFASRGTPVIAASSGRVRSVGNNRLGGRVVWLFNSRLKHSQYYAHLDSQLVRAGEKVNIGDTLGLVGNSGNALTTSPHLHFGIYTSGRGAVDPFPFLEAPNISVSTAISDSIMLGSQAIIKSTVANIRSSPGTSSKKMGTYERNTLLRIDGKAGGWFRISLPDNQKGFIYGSLVEQPKEPIRQIELNPLDEIRESWDTPYPISGAIISGTAHVLGEFENNYFLKTAGGIEGWWRGIR